MTECICFSAPVKGCPTHDPNEAASTRITVGADDGCYSNTDYSIWWDPDRACWIGPNGPVTLPLDSQPPRTQPDPPEEAWPVMKDATSWLDAHEGTILNKAFFDAIKAYIDNRKMASEPYPYLNSLLPPPDTKSAK